MTVPETGFIALAISVSATGIWLKVTVALVLAGAAPGGAALDALDARALYAGPFNAISSHILWIIAGLMISISADGLLARADHRF